MAGNRFFVKVTVSPSGLVKVSEGLQPRKGSTKMDFRPILVNPSKLQGEIKHADRQAHNTSPVEREEIRSGWGALGHKRKMSAKTARNLRERMIALELEFGKENLFFNTLTLPCDNPESFLPLARWTSFAVNRLNVFINDNFKDKKLARCGVWEYQKRGALHYHFVLGSHCMDAINIDEFRSKIAIAWMHILESIGERENIDMFEQNRQTRDKSRLLDYGDLGKRFANVQIVEKSVSAYLSSYLAESNHDDNCNKNILREKLFPVATWAQWDRHATELFYKYSFECEKIIKAENIEDFNDWKAILFASLEPVEGTEKLERKNHWFYTECLISKEKGKPLKDLVIDAFKMLSQSGLCRGIFDGFKLISRQKIEQQWERECLIHDAEFIMFERAYLQRKMIKNMASKLVVCIAGMQSIMIRCEKELKEHRAFDSELKNYHQIRLDYASQN